MKLLKILAVATLLMPTVASAQTAQLTVPQLQAQLNRLTPQQLATLEQDIGTSLSGMSVRQFATVLNSLSAEDRAQLSQALQSQRSLVNSRIVATNFTLPLGGSLLGLLVLNRNNNALPLPAAPTSTTRTN